MVLVRDKEMTKSMGKLADDTFLFIIQRGNTLNVSLYHPPLYPPLATVAVTFVGNSGPTPSHHFSSLAATCCGNGRQGRYHRAECCYCPEL